MTQPIWSEFAGEIDRVNAHVFTSTGDLSGRINVCQQRFSLSPYVKRDLEITVTKTRGQVLPKLGGCLGRVYGQPGAGKSVTLPYKLAMHDHHPVVITVPDATLATLNSKYMKTARAGREAFGIELLTDFDFSEDIEFKPKHIYVTTPAVLLIRYLNKPDSYKDCTLVLDEVQMCDHWTFALRELLQNRRISYCALFASATHDASDAADRQYMKTSNYSDVETLNFNAGDFTKWSANADVDREQPWHVGNIKGGTLIFNDDVATARRLCTEYKIAGIKSVVIRKDTLPSVIEGFLQGIGDHATERFVIIADSHYTSGYTFPVTVVVDSGCVVSSFVSSMGTDFSLYRHIFRWEEVQRSGRAARVYSTDKGLYHKPIQVAPSNYVYYLAPEFMEPACVLMRLLSMQLPIQLTSNVSATLLEMELSNSVLNLFTANVPFGSIYAVLNGDPHIPRGLKYGGVFKCYVSSNTVRGPESVADVDGCQVLSSRMRSIFADGLIKSKNPATVGRAAGSAWRAMAVGDATRIMRTSDSIMETGKGYEPHMLYALVEYPPDLPLPDSYVDHESFFRNLRNSPAPLYLGRDEAALHFAVVLRAMNEEALAVQTAVYSRLYTSQCRTDGRYYPPEITGVMNEVYSSALEKYRYYSFLARLFQRYKFGLAETEINESHVADLISRHVPRVNTQPYSLDETNASLRSYSQPSGAEAEYRERSRFDGILGRGACGELMAPQSLRSLTYGDRSALPSIGLGTYKKHGLYCRLKNSFDQPSAKKWDLSSNSTLRSNRSSGSSYGSSDGFEPLPDFRGTGELSDQIGRELNFNDPQYDKVAAAIKESSRLINRPLH